MTTDRLFDLLPVHWRARDERSGGLLAALLTAVGGELDILEHDIDELYDSWFIQTCPDWVIPYIADLLGVDDLPGDSGAGRRAYVANTVAYRRGKGTIGVLEQVAADVSGWPAVAVEYYRRLAATTHVNHVHLQRPATADVHGTGDLLVTAQAALDPRAHTTDVRSTSKGRGRHGISTVGVFLFDDSVCEVTCDAVAGSGGWALHPAGWDMPLYAAPARETGIEAMAGEANLPVPLRPRRLLSALRAARTDPDSALPLAVAVDGVRLGPQQVRVCGLEDLAALPGWQVLVDPVHGRLHPYHDGAATDPASITTTHVYGATADVGAGAYDRAQVHADVLADDPFPGDPQVVAQVAVPDDEPDVGAAVATALTTPGATVVVSISDSATYPGDVTITVPAATRLVLVGATWPQRILGPGEVEPPIPGVYAAQSVRPHIAGNVTVVAGGGSSVILDGLLITGDVVVDDGDLAALTLSQCTVAGSVRVGANPGAAIRLVRSVTGPLTCDPTAAEVQVTDSVMDAQLGGGGGVAVHGDGVGLSLGGSTVRGSIAVRTLYASSSILDGDVTVEDRQTGCVRFSFVPSGQRVPRRYRCAPGDEDDPLLRPQYRSVAPGSPHYLTLATTCPAAIATGGEHESEMGVHHHLHRPARVLAVRRLLAGYAPVGIHTAVASLVATGGS